MGDGLQDGESVEVIPFEPRYRDDFQRLNVEWLEKYFHVEAIDREVLSHPEERILKPGGFVFLARYKDDIVGTCALIKAGRGRMELSKMAALALYEANGFRHSPRPGGESHYERSNVYMVLEPQSRS